MCARPDYRTGRYRARVHAARNAERRAREAERKRLDDWLRRLHRSVDQDMYMIAMLEQDITEALTTSKPTRQDVLRSAAG
jgi:hypothetical protein